MTITFADDTDAFEAALNFVDEYDETDSTSSALPSSSDAIRGFHGENYAEEGAVLTLLSLPTDVAGNEENSDAISSAEAAVATAKINQRTAKKPKKSVGETATSKRQRPPSYNPNYARDQRRKELLYLREKVVEMEQDLMALRTARGSTTLALKSVDKSGLEGHQDGGVSSTAMWKEVADSQLEQRLRAERENRRLKAVLEGQIKIGKSLEKLLEASSTTQPMESCVHTHLTQRIHTSAPDRSDSDKFAELLAGLDDWYRNVDDMLGMTGLADKDYSYSDASMREGPEGIYMEMLASKVLPFDVFATGTAAWEYFSRSLEHRPYHFSHQKEPQNLETTNDTIVERFGMKLHANGTQADFNAKQVVRRYVEEDRVVIVWRSFIDPIEFLGTPLCGADFREDGYIVARRPKCKAPGVALLQTCYFITPVTPVFSLSDEGAITGALTDFVLSGTAANIASSHQMIENILLNEAMKSHGHD